MIWREKKWLLIGLGLFLAVNVVFFLTYRVRYEERVHDLEERLDQARSTYSEAHQERLAAERELRAYRKASSDVATVYDEWWATPRERLAPLIVELRNLAQKSGLTPNTRSYATQGIQKIRSVNINASTMTITFSVQGSYEQVRRLINLIEMSQHFIIIQQIGLGDTAKENPGANLNLSLTLKTLFREEPAKGDRS